MEFKGKEIEGHKAISALLKPDIYVKGKETGLRWAVLIEMGISARQDRFERNDALREMEKLRRVVARQEAILFKLQEATP